MITLYQPPPAWELPTVSPFCVKLETYLKMTNLPYKVAQGNPMQAPKGKVPYIELDGNLLGDSELIIRRLKEQHGDPLDQNLTAEQRATALALKRLVEDHLYFASAWLRWNSPESWPYVAKFFKSMMPPVIGGLILSKIRKNFRRALWAQGTGRHSADEILQFAKEDLTAISVLLGRKSYFLGEAPTSVDATMYGFLIQQLWVPWDSPLKAYAQTLTNLTTYCERMKKQYWS